MGSKKSNIDNEKLREELSNIKKEPFVEKKVKKKAHFDPHFLFKVLLVGHNDTGKITYLENYGNSWFKANTKLSIGISFEIKEIKIESLNIKLQIWDLATEERWRVLVPLYCRGALGALLMFEISNSKTLYILPKWIQIIRDNTNNIPLILMGNNDNSNNLSQVSKEQALEFLRSEQLDAYFECNVLTGENLKNVFESLTRMIIKKYENNT
ncbi:MAG: Rab family GTPase [Promethearchaeota archaeon]